MRKAILVGLILISFGCVSSNLQPNPIPLGAYDMVAVRPGEAVGLVNGHTPGFSMIPYGTKERETDISRWSGQAVTLLSAWLVKYGVPLDPNAAKKMTVSIVEPKISLQKHLPCARLTLKIEADGLNKTFPTEGCARGVNSAVGYAISYAVIDLMRDREVTAYIEGR